MTTPHQARFYETLSGARVRCTLCPHDCIIADGGRGAALDVLFADPNLALNAVYRSGGAGAGDGVPVLLILRRPDQIVAYGDTRIVSETVQLDIRTSDVPAPRAADIIDVDGTIYLIQGEPLRDPERLVWTIKARPQ